MRKRTETGKAGTGTRNGLARVAPAALLLVLAASSARTADKVTWKRVADAMLKIDNRSAKVWSLYHAEKDKKDHRLLLQIGTRYLMIDTKLRFITEYDPATFEKKGEAYEMEREAKGVKAIATDDWVLRDVGTSYLIHTQLKEEGRVLEIQLPKMPDFRNVLW